MVGKVSKIEWTTKKCMFISMYGCKFTKIQYIWNQGNRGSIEWKIALK